MRPRIFGGSKIQSLNTETQGCKFLSCFVATIITGKQESWLTTGRLGLEKGQTDILVAQDGEASDVSHGWIQHHPLQDPKSVCVCVCACACAQSCPTLCGPNGLSVEFSWQECWSGLPFPSPGDFGVSCIGRQILYPCATWEAQNSLYKQQNYKVVRFADG